MSSMTGRPVTPWMWRYGIKGLAAWILKIKRGEPMLLLAMLAVGYRIYQPYHGYPQRQHFS